MQKLGRVVLYLMGALAIASLGALVLASCMPESKALALMQREVVSVPAGPAMTMAATLPLEMPLAMGGPADPPTGPSTALRFVIATDLSDALLRLPDRCGSIVLASGTRQKIIEQPISIRDWHYLDVDLAGAELVFHLPDDAVGIDLVGCEQVMIRNGAIEGHGGVGVLLGRSDLGVHSGRIVLDNMRLAGEWQLATLYDVGADLCELRSTTIYNGAATTGCFGALFTCWNLLDVPNVAGGTDPGIGYGDGVVNNAGTVCATNSWFGCAGSAPGVPLGLVGASNITLTNCGFSLKHSGARWALQIGWPGVGGNAKVSGLRVANMIGECDTATCFMQVYSDLDDAQLDGRLRIGRMSPTILVAPQRGCRQFHDKIGRTDL
jgi:hypothetical protein